MVFRIMKWMPIQVNLMDQKLSKCLELFRNALVSIVKNYRNVHLKFGWMHFKVRAQGIAHQ